MNKKMTEKNINKKQGWKHYVYHCLLVFFGIFLITALVYGLIFAENKISGKAVMDINANYREGESLAGVLEFSLKEGELIPSSSRILFENSEQKYEYDLSDFNLSDNLVEGDFYMKGKSLYGSGLGYGIKGKKVIYPKVSFVLKISSQKKSTGEVNEEKTQEKKEDVKETEESEEVSSEEIIKEESEENPEEESDETEELTTEKLEESETGEVAEEIKAEEEEEQTISEEEPEEIPEESSEQTNDASITGNVIIGLLNKISNFFLGLTGTGMAVAGAEEEIQGEVSLDEPFIYNLKEGQTAEIVSSSQDVNLTIEDDIATITTDYFEEEEGFGEDYLGNDEKIIIINLSELDLLFEEGEVKASLAYEDMELVSLSVLLEEGKNIENGSFEEESVSNETLEVNKNISLNKSEEIIEESVNNLNDKEKKILFDKLGNVSLKITKVELVEGGIEITFELGDYFMIRFYDEDFSEKDLENQVERDRINWLKDIANALSQKENDSKEIEKFIGEYPV